MKNLFDEIRQMSEANVVPQGTKKNLTPLKAKIEEPMHIPGYGVVSKKQLHLLPKELQDQARPTNLHKEDTNIEEKWVNHPDKPAEGLKRDQTVSVKAPMGKTIFGKYLRTDEKTNKHLVMHNHDKSLHWHAPETVFHDMSDYAHSEFVKESEELEEVFADQGSGHSEKGSNTYKKVHRVSVTVSDPNATAVSKRSEKIQKIARIPHEVSDKDGALARAKTFYKKRGYKVHDAEHIGFLKEANEGTDHITMTVPLFIRCLEWAHEDAKDDVELHKFVEKVVAKGGVLATEDYEEFLGESTLSWKEEQRKRAAELMKKLDAAPDPTPEQKKKNDVLLAKLLKNRDKYKDIMGS
jgi:hypothetical protein